MCALKLKKMLMEKEAAKLCFSKIIQFQSSKKGAFKFQKFLVLYYNNFMFLCCIFILPHILQKCFLNMCGVQNYKKSMQYPNIVY
jgi:hypothetical protein